MENTNRRLRSSGPITNSPAETPTLVKSPITFIAPSLSSKPPEEIAIIRPGCPLPDISPNELSLLRRKQEKLAKTAASTLHSLPAEKPHLIHALESSLIFAQEVAGSAVCVDAAGWILTCSHCICDFEDEYQADSKRRWLLFYTGLAVQVECRFWDPKRDLALLKIIAVEAVETGESGQMPIFPFVQMISSAPSVRASIVCIGQPGADDLESEKARKTKYNLVEISEGAFQGMVLNANPQDNSKIGTLMHDAWTYWGHSGAPLLREADGTLIGLHSSWDSETAMRRGIPLVAVEQFLRQALPSVGRPEVSLTAVTAAEHHQAKGHGSKGRVPRGQTSNSAKAKNAKEDASIVLISDSE